jgi:hypothetical protein
VLPSSFTGFRFEVGSKEDTIPLGGDHDPSLYGAPKANDQDVLYLVSGALLFEAVIR